MSVQVRRRRAIAAAVLVVVLGVVVVLAARGLGGAEPPATGAAALAPKDTLVYAHVSTDTGRGATGRAAELAARFDVYERARDTVLAQLTGTEQEVTAEDVEPWLGDEAALALVDAGQATAGSLVIVAVTDAEKARELFERSPRSLVIVAVTDAEKARELFERSPRRSAVRRYKGDRIDEFGTVNVAIKDGWLLIGQGPTVQGALDRANGRGEALAGDATYRRAMEGAPEDRVGSVYATAGGLRRLLAPQGDVVGTLAVLFDDPALQGVALSAVAEEDALRIRAHSALDPEAQRRAGGVAKAFEPELLDAVPGDAMAYLGTTGISGALGNLITAAAGGANAGGVGPLLERLRTELAKQSGGDLERDLLGLFDGEVAIVLGRAMPAPTLALVTQTADEDRTAQILRRLQEPLAELLTPEGEQAPRWRTDEVAGGVRAQTLATPSGAEVTYAVFDGRLVLGTGPEAIRRIQGADGGLEDAEALQEARSSGERATSLGFLDFSQLLELGEQTGLNDDRAYLSARDDLRRIKAIGFSSRASEGETTAEILLQIP